MLANTCLADNLSTLSTFNWGKLQLLNVDFFVYIKLSTFLCQKAVSPYISTLSCVFHQMAFLWKLFLSTLSTFFIHDSLFFKRGFFSFTFCILLINLFFTEKNTSKTLDFFWVSQIEMQFIMDFQAILF